jgi:hypothetical protein
MVVDDLGTVYRHESGEAGGHGTEFRSRWNFLRLRLLQRAG